VQQQLCHEHEKSALLQYKKRIVINSSLAGDPFTAYPKLDS